MNRLSYAAIFLLGLAACHSQTSQPATAESGSAPKTAAAEEPTATDSPGASYRVYRGLLPGQADSITLHLVTAPQPRYDEPGPSSSGSYYGLNGHPYEVGGQPSALDSLVLTDYSPEHGASPTSVAPVWRLRQQPDGSLTGTVGGQATRLRLVPALPGSLTFAVRCLADSLAAFSNQSASPKGRMRLQTLVPTGGPAAVRKTLLAAINRELRGDTLDTTPALALSVLFKQQRDSFFVDYRRQVIELRGDSSDGQPSAMLNFEEQAATTVLFRQGDLLSLGFFSYSYAGGAHGLNGTTGASYDLRTGRRLRYNDIFLPAAQAQLSALLGRAVRSLVNEQLSVKQMPVTHNVFLTAGGVEFIYQPYEIASYAQGEVRVFLPLAQVRPLLREGLPLPGATVAKR